MSIPTSDKISLFADELHKWIKGIGKNIFTLVDNNIIACVTTTVQKCPKLTNSSEKKDEVDPML